MNPLLELAPALFRRSWFSQALERLRVSKKRKISMVGASAISQRLARLIVQAWLAVVQADDVLAPLAASTLEI